MIIAGIGLLCSLISLLVCLAYDWKKRSPFVILWLLSIVFVVLPLAGIFLDANSDLDLIAASSVFISACNSIYISVCLTIDYALYREKNIVRHTLNLSLSSRKTFIIWILVISIPLVLIVNGVNLTTLLESTLADKRALTTWYLVIIILSCSLFPAVLYSIKNQKKFLTVAIIIVFILIALYFRSRSMLVMLLLPIGYHLLFSSRKGPIKLLLLGVAAYFASQIIKIIRYQGSLRDGLNIYNWGETTEYVLSNSLASGDLSIVRVFLQITQDCGTRLICGEWTLIEKYLSKIYLAPSVNSTFEYYLYDVYIESGVNGSLHPTAYGFAYGDGGQYFGLIYFLLLPLLRLFLHEILIKSSRSLFYIGFVMYFILYFSRGSVYNSLTLLFVPIIFELTLRSLSLILDGIRNQKSNAKPIN